MFTGFLRKSDWRERMNHLSTRGGVEKSSVTRSEKEEKSPYELTHPDGIDTYLGHVYIVVDHVQYVLVHRH